MHRFEGCLIGGAIGDALGWPVEFMSRDQITEKYGYEGITGFLTQYTYRAKISDDTQMTMFTTEGLLRSFVSKNERGGCDLQSTVYKSYLRWLSTQGWDMDSSLQNGWVLGIKGLHYRRAPGSSCLSALKSGVMGSMEKPVNDSKGCGGVMRVAPVGLVMDIDDAFRTGAEIAAITHGHPSGYLAAGVLSRMIREIIDGRELNNALEASIDELKLFEGHEECLKALENAVQAAAEKKPSPEKLAELGEGWVAEEALAISVYCALVYRDSFRDAVLLAVNHGGDSDSTGAITGSIMGTYLGIQGIPEEWVYRVELSPEIRELAQDLYKRYKNHDIWRYKYPGE